MATRKEKFDDLDYQIIRCLHQNARMAASEIARITQANERTIRNRIERLEADGAIRLTAILDPAAFGYSITVDIFLEIERDREQEVIDRLKALPEITYIALGQETSEISIESRFKDNMALREFLGYTLPSIPGVKVTRYAIVPRILRNIDEWLPPKEEFLENGKEL